MFWSAGCSLLRAEGFFCNLDVLYGGLGIRIGLQPKMPYPDPYQINTDPKPWSWAHVNDESPLIFGSWLSFFDGFGEVLTMVADPYPDSIGSVDPDPYSESGSGSRRAKMTNKSRKKFKKFMFWSVGWPLLSAEGFFCNFDVLYGGLGIGKLYR